MNNPTLGRIRDWLTRRPFGVVVLRVFDQTTRIFTGAPIVRYSKITPQLYVGGQYRKHGLPLMKAYGITSVVNLRREFDDMKAGIAPEHYLYLPTPDNHPPSMENLHKGVEFIKNEIEQGRTVYIHCGIGVGRAPTMAAAYLVAEGLTPSEAWRTIREVRPFIWPLRGQVMQVSRYVEELESISGK